MFRPFKKLPQQKRARVVTPCIHTPESKGKKGVKLYAFSHYDLAYLLNVSVATIRRYIREGKLKPTDLASICRFFNDKQPD